ncbi:GNAT family N-acetyltransferase [Tateyamaria sp.]
MLALGQGAVAVDGDTPVGTILWWRHADAATLGMVIVDGAARGQGIGAMLVKRALKATEGLPVFLYATDMALRGYAALGFVECGLVHQFQGVVDPADVLDHRVARANAHDMPSIVTLDEAARGWGRGPFLGALIDHGARPWCLKDGGRIQAYALERRAGRGRVVGPIVAKDSDTAGDLARAIAWHHAGQFVRLDTDPELGLSEVLPDLGLGV